MNGIEVEAVIFAHQMTRHTMNDELKKKLATVRRIEQQQQKMINWLLPGQESTLEVTIGYEQVAVDLTAFLAKTVSDQYVKAALDFALIEDFDHLYRYSNLYEMLERKQAKRIVGDYTEIFPGRPTIAEHRHAYDSVNNHIDSKTADPLTKLHVMTITAAEQQTMNYYMNVGNRFDDEVARGLYLEIAQIEEQHVTHYETLNDPNMTWFERLVMHEYHECYLYYYCMISEVDERIKKIWQENLECEIEHLKLAIELAKQVENQDYSYLCGDFPQPTVFESNKDYVRRIIGEQIDYTADGPNFVPPDKMTHWDRYRWFQEHVNSGEYVPSQKIIEEHINRFGEDYRLETNGPHPVQRLQRREWAVV
jgi:rubrerythrin